MLVQQGIRLVGRLNWRPSWNSWLNNNSNNNNNGPLIPAVTDALALHYCTLYNYLYNYFRHSQMSKVRTMSWYFFNSIDSACLSANYCELLQAFTRWQGTLFMAFQASNRHSSHSSHIFVSPPTSHRPSWYQFIQLGEQRTLGCK